MPLAGLLGLGAWGTLAGLARQAGPVNWPALGGLLALAWLALAWAWPARGTGFNRRTERWVVGYGLLFRLAAFLTLPVFDDDLPRYLWDGWQLLSTGQPYDRAPAEFFGAAQVPPALLPWLGQINYPELPTVYPPPAQALFGLAAAAQPGAWWPLKLGLLAADLWLWWRVRQVGGRRASLFYGWCPLGLFETGVGAHIDVLAAVFLVEGWFAVRRRRAGPAGLWLGLALATRPWVLPVVWALGRRQPARLWVAVGAAWAAGYLPFWLQGSLAEWPTMLRAAAAWEFNSALPGLLGAGLPAPWPRRLAAVAGLLGWLAWSWRHRDRPGRSTRPEELLGGFWAVAPVVNPWYLVLLLPWAALRRPAWAVAALVMVPLSYATSLHLGHPLAGPYEHPGWVRPVEFGVVLAVAWWAGRRRPATPAPAAE